MGDVQFSLPLLIDSPLIGKIKNDRTMMVWNFFSLTRERQDRLPIYDDGTIRIEVKAPPTAMVMSAALADIAQPGAAMAMAAMAQRALRRINPSPSAIP